MKILFIAHRMPYPPNKGEKIRAYHLIRHLSIRHSVHLACLVDERAELANVEILEKYCVAVDVVYKNKVASKVAAVGALFSKKPLTVAFFHSKELKRKIAQRLSSEHFDKIIVYSSSMGEYVRQVAEIPKVIDFVDVDSEKWRLYGQYQRFPLSWIYRLEADRLARYEKELAYAFNHSVVISETEAELLRCRVSDRPISVISYGIDLDYFHPERTDSGSSFTTPAIVFTGTMDYFPNTDAVQYFCKDIFPFILKALPQARFYIVGRNPTRDVKALGERPNVIVTGTVPDVRPYLAAGRVVVAPLRIARGIQAKILEAMAMGLPVVGTSLAFQGLRAVEEDGIRMADEPEQFTADVVALLQDPDLQRQCALRARRYVQRYHRWQEHGVQLERLLQAVN